MVVCLVVVCCLFGCWLWFVWLLVVVCLLLFHDAVLLLVLLFIDVFCLLLFDDSNVGVVVVRSLCVASCVLFYHLSVVVCLRSFVCFVVFCDCCCCRGCCRLVVVICVLHKGR